MGREVRRVPPNWEHPKASRVGLRNGRYSREDEYVPMFDRDVETAWNEWLAEYHEWCREGHAKATAEYGTAEYPPNQPYPGFCKWHGGPPDPRSYRPRWPDGSATWYQVYETVSEGTPVTPPFATTGELVDYLCTHGDFWDQARRAEGRTEMSCGPWDRKAAEAFVGAGWAPSMMVTSTGAGVEIKTARDGV